MPYGLADVSVSTALPIENGNGSVSNTININVPEIVTQFLERQAAYASRNYLLDLRADLFEGRHWPGEGELETEYQLVLNYCRNIVLRFVAILARSPRPQVPIPTAASSAMSQAANRKEKLLLCVWPDLMKAWADVEMNASKYSYGVLQVLWSPKAGEPAEVQVGVGEDTTTAKTYTRSPFKFRSIPPENFMPIYRTFDDPNDYMAVYRWDPMRLVSDLERMYGKSLTPSPSGIDEEVISVLPTADLVEYWSSDVYALIAMTTAQVREGRSRGARADVVERNYYVVLEAGKNPYRPDLPFFVLQNIRSDPNVDPTTTGSMADLDDVSGLNKHYNELVSEEAEEIAINIHRPLVYKSDEHLQDPEGISYSPGSVYPIGLEEELDPLEWGGQPAFVMNHLDRIRSTMRDLSFLGNAGFGEISAGATGIGLNIALTPLQQITELKLPLRIDALQSIARFVLRCFEQKADKDAKLQQWIKDRFNQYAIAVVSPDDIKRDYYTDIVYGNLLPRDDATFEQNEVYKFKTGVQSLWTTIQNLGHHDPDQEIARIKEEAQDAVLSPEKASIIKQLQTSEQQQKAMQGNSAPGLTGQSPMRPGMTGQFGQQNPAIGGGASGLSQMLGGLPTGPALPGTAQPGTTQVKPGTMGGFPGGPAPVGGSLTAPPVPGRGAFPRNQEGGGFGPGRLAPFIRRPAER